MARVEQGAVEGRTEGGEGIWMRARVKGTAAKAGLTAVKVGLMAARLGRTVARVERMVARVGRVAGLTWWGRTDDRVVGTAVMIAVAGGRLRGAAAQP